MVFAVVTGGGTSGHVLPARAVIESLEDSGIALSDLAYVGSRRGVESSMMADLAERGVRCAYLPVSGLQRSLRPGAIAANLALAWRLPRSRAMAARLRRRWAPRVVVSVGGYASEPMSRAAIAAGVPLVCVSYDRIPGLATRRQSRRAAVCAVAFPDSGLPRAVHTGAPVRRDIRTLRVGETRDGARRALGVPVDAVLITVTGGSLGSASLNHLVPDLIARLSNVGGGPFALYHVCGPRHASDPSPEAPEGVWYRRVAYEDDMASLYAATDVLICRAGASTIAEIATVGVAAVIVPWPGAAEDHQRLNASWLGDQGSALVLEDSALTGRAALDEIVGLIVDPAARARLAGRARDMGEMHRGGALARVIRSAAG